jgi:acetolactate decarboxylase
MAFDERLIGAIHVESAEGEGGVFQASTITSLIDGAYDGEVTFAELAQHGDTGIGTLNGLDGEMVAVDGRFMQAKADGTISDVPPDARTPFAVLTRLEPRHRLELGALGSLDELGAAIDAEVGHPEQVHALRIEGRFARVHARSVPKQTPPYRPLAEVIETQTVFDFEDAEGTIVGFRFPDREEGLNVPGYHLHFVTADRSRGGHVLDCASESVRVEVDDTVDVHLQLPDGVDLESAEDDATALRRIEREDAGTD